MAYDAENKIEETVILIGVQQEDSLRTEESLEELGELARTAGAKVCAGVIQKRESVHPGTYIGKGKIEEVRELLQILDANGVICDDELSPAQMKNLQEELDCKVMDRTLLILDIFAGRARTREGKIQVELAQLKYRSARLAGLGTSLSRLGGGIGTRGPGEKKLEMDRRLIRARIGQLRRELEEVKRHREVVRSRRSRNNQKIAALVGYSSSGKSTTLNYLTGAEVLADEMLFSTLDTTTRILKLDQNQEILLTDTVGFIRKLPHHLVEAFQSTLEEARYADIIIHVADASNPQMETQMEVVYETLKQLQVVNKPVVTIFNKQDKLEEKKHFRDFRADYSLEVSAKTGEGMKELKEVLGEILRKGRIYLEHLYPYESAGKIQIIRKYGELLEEEYQEDGIRIKGYIPGEYYAAVTES